MISIAVDCMSGDHGISVIVPACRAFLLTHPKAHLILVGDEVRVRAVLATLPKTDRSELEPRMSVVHACEIVAMDEAPAAALRGKKDSSMRVAVNQVKSGEADGCVSAGNTGALMAISRFVLKTLDGIDRPAIASQLPNQKGGATVMLDLGANVDCTPEHYLQFAYMGAALASSLGGSASASVLNKSLSIENQKQPSIGLLNIGEEATKGNETVKQAGELLRQSNLNYFGNIEGNDIYLGTVDVVVCDGFVGNVALKTSEGVAQMLGQFIKEEFSQDPLSRIMALLASPVLKRFKHRLDHRRYNGACLIGLKGVVVKSHGSADELAFEYALGRAYDAIENCLVERISQGIESNRKPSPTPHQDPADIV